MAILQLQPSYEYPHHLKEHVTKAPSAPGVYLLFGEDPTFPLYIGKSINIRARLLSHLRTPEEAKLLRQSRFIETICTAGEVGALLLESRLIKERQPLFNKRLRRTKRLCSISVEEGKLAIESTTALSSNKTLYGLFRSKQAALKALLTLADNQQLCLATLGLEKVETGKACFRFQIKKCRGACCGEENLTEHNSRFLEALQTWRVHYWPFDGPIAIYESQDSLEEFHVINEWHYLGTYTTLKAAKKAPWAAPKSFDADTYKILVRPLLTQSVKTISLKPEPKKQKSPQ